MKNDYHDKHVELRRSENFHRLLLARPVPYRLFGSWDSLFPLKGVERSYHTVHMNTNEYDDIFYLGFFPMSVIPFYIQFSWIMYVPYEWMDLENPHLVAGNDWDTIFHEHFDLSHGGFMAFFFIAFWNGLYGIYLLTGFCTSIAGNI